MSLLYKLEVGGAVLIFKIYFLIDNVSDLERWSVRVEVYFKIKDVIEKFIKA